MYDRILLPTDGRPGAEGARRHAVDLASATDATLHALFVVDEDIYTAYSGDEFVHEQEGAEAALEQAGQDAVEAVADLAAEAGVEARTELRHGTPHVTIVAYADEIGADLIVLGTKVQDGAYRKLLGSVTDRVARLADQPVTIVKPDAE
ncbi:MAG: universal stress protein [Haloarculaceae archaeon]